MFLTDDQIEFLTGYRRPREQLSWLRSNGVAHYRNGRGRPVVPVDAVQGKMWKPRPDLSKLD